MTRRNWFCRLFAGMAAMAGLGQAMPSDLRKVWRESERDGRPGWDRVRMFDVRPGDRLLIEDIDGVWVATGHPYWDEEAQVWAVMGEKILDSPRWVVAAGESFDVTIGQANKG